MRPGGGADRVCCKREMGAVGERHAVEQKERVVAVGHGSSLFLTELTKLTTEKDSACLRLHHVEFADAKSSAKGHDFLADFLRRSMAWGTPVRMSCGVVASPLRMVMVPRPKRRRTNDSSADGVFDPKELDFLDVLAQEAGEETDALGGDDVFDRASGDSSGSQDG